MDDLRDLYQEIILDHGKAPRNFRHPEDANHESYGHNPMCGDRVSELGTLTVLSGVKAFPSRIKCATLPWHTFVAALDGREETTTTD